MLIIAELKKKLYFPDEICRLVNLLYYSMSIILTIKNCKYLPAWHMPCKILSSLNCVSVLGQCATQLRLRKITHLLKAVCFSFFF